jgi:hypothetical protein
VTKPLLIQEINRIIAEYSETKSKKSKVGNAHLTFL